MLNSVRYNAARLCVRNVHWLHALVAATTIVWSAPSSSSAAKSTAYEIDIVDPLVARGRETLRAEATDEHTRSAMNNPGLATECGAKYAPTSAPATQTAMTYSRAATGSCFIVYIIYPAEPGSRSRLALAAPARWLGVGLELELHDLPVQRTPADVEHPRGLLLVPLDGLEHPDDVRAFGVGQ